MFSVGWTSWNFLDASVWYNGSIGLKQLLFLHQPFICPCVLYTGSNTALTDRIKSEGVSLFGAYIGHYVHPPPPAKKTNKQKTLLLSLACWK